MRLEIAERLRCPRTHAPTPLVLVAERVVERELIKGVAGCPVCLSEARIVDGNVVFEGAGSWALAAASAPVAGARAGQEAFDRLVALLLLGEPGGAVLLTGEYSRFAAPLADALDIAVVVMEAPPVPMQGVCSVRLGAPVVPFSDHTFRAAALDPTLSAAFAADAVRTVVVGGRVVGSAALAVPPFLCELARDQAEWLAEREVGPAGVVRIRRA